MGSYYDEYEAMRQRHREAVARKRLADRQAQVEAIGRMPTPPPIPPPAPPPLPPPRPVEVPLVMETPRPPAPEPPPPPEPWSPGARSGRAWLGHYADVHGPPQEALLPSAVPGHILVVGASGMGKTRLLLLLAGEALADGASVVALELKSAQMTLGRLSAVADEAGLDPRDRALFLPSASPGPGWNPLLEGREAVGEILAVFKGLAGGSWGPKMETLFRAALGLLIERKLSLYELPKLIGDPAYLRALAEGSGPSLLGDYLLERVTGKDADTDPVLNKLLPVLDVPYFERCLCAERNTFAMTSLWRRRQLACFHLDHKRLQESAGVLGAMAAYRLFTAAVEPSGPGRVVLLADEAEDVDRLSGGQLVKTLARGRESRLSLLLACQHLGQLSEGLRKGALTSASLVCFFRVGPEDVRDVDRFLGDGWGAQAAQLGPQHCVVQVNMGTPRVVRVADLDPRPEQGWERQGAHLAQGEWEGLAERRREGMRAVVGGALPRLDAPEGGSGPKKRPATPAPAWPAEPPPSRLASPAPSRPSEPVPSRASGLAPARPVESKSTLPVERPPERRSAPAPEARRGPSSDPSPARAPHSAPDRHPDAGGLVPKPPVFRDNTAAQMSNEVREVTEAREERTARREDDAPVTIPRGWEDDGIS